MQWLLDLYADCERGSGARWSGPGTSWLEELNSCAAWHVDSVLLILLLAILALLAARRLGWICLHPREIVFFVICLGLAPLYVGALWTPQLSISGLLAGLAVYAFGAVILFALGVLHVFRHRKHGPMPAPMLVGVLFLAFLTHGCMHQMSYWGIGS